MPRRRVECSDFSRSKGANLVRLRRRLFVLQGLPGVGPALAQRLLAQLGSVERVMTAGAAELAVVRGIGSKKAARIREIVSR
jgi:ERCC4-type nuclease